MRRGTLQARRLGAIALVVLAAHLLLLGGIREAMVETDAAAPGRHAQAVQVRTKAPAQAATVAAEAPEMRTPRLPRQPSREPSLAVTTELAAGPSTRVQAVEGAEEAPATEPATPPAGDLPVYRTILPPPFAFGYAIERGALGGSGELQWRPQGERYEARLEARGAGVPTMAWHSAGSFDAAGLAPLRYTDRRRGRGAQAANFRRDEGRVTFSGPAVEHALPPGAQDRLSWMLQLAAIAAAEPSLVGPGGQVSFLVVGARGDADVWTFLHVGLETLALPEGAAPTVRLLREPRRAWDTRAEVWLDPARHYLPVRARLSNGVDSQALQLTLRAVLPSP